MRVSGQELSVLFKIIILKFSFSPFDTALHAHVHVHVHDFVLQEGNFPFASEEGSTEYRGALLHTTTQSQRRFAEFVATPSFLQWLA